MRNFGNIWILVSLVIDVNQICVLPFLMEDTNRLTIRKTSYTFIRQKDFEIQR